MVRSPSQRFPTFAYCIGRTDETSALVDHRIRPRISVPEDNAKFNLVHEYGAVGSIPGA